jgi:1-deoxy-D-xylulose-5-phosphate synthase
LFTALSLNGPVVLRYPRGRSECFNKPIKPTLLPVGRGEWVKQGSELVFLAVGTMVQAAVKAAELLEKKGICAGVVNARFVKPHDGELVAMVARRARWIVTIEENSLMGGFGSAVLESLNDAGIEGTRILRLGLPDCFVEQGSREELLECLGLDPAGIAESTCKFIGADSYVTTSA